VETYLTVRELAGKVHLTEQTIYRYVMKKAIPFHKINRAVRFRPSEIEGWIGGREKAHKSCGGQTGDLFAGAEVNERGKDRGASETTGGYGMTDMDKAIEEAKASVMPFESWERLPGESGLAYSAFCAYRDLGLARNIRKAVEAAENDTVKREKKYRVSFDAA
jgi:excisionase family DNA binding protein